MYTVTINGKTIRTNLTARGAWIALSGIRWEKSIGISAMRGWYEIWFNGTIIAQGMV